MKGKWNEKETLFYVKETELSFNSKRIDVREPLTYKFLSMSEFGTNAWFAIDYLLLGGRQTKSTSESCK